MAASTSAPLTGHQDFKTDYRKRRLSKRKRRVFARRRKWARKVVNTVRNATVGSTHVVRRSHTNAGTLVNQTGNLSFGMYGLNGNPNPDGPCNDIGVFMQDAVGPTKWSQWESASLTSVDNKIHSLHATMEFTMHNLSTVDIIAEVYYIRARKRINGIYWNPSYIYNMGFLKQEKALDPDEGTSPGFAELASTDVGVTPFQNALFCRHFKIFKRQKYRVPVGGEVSFTMTDRRRRIFTMANTKPFALGPEYSGVLVQWQGVPDVLDQAPATSNIVFTTQRRYRFKLQANDEVRDTRI